MNNSQLTYLWHDYETWGVNPRRDLPAQFASIRTDANLNIIGEPVMIYCKPQPDFLPDAYAAMVTGITPQVCLEKGLPEPEFAAAIQRELGAPNTIGIGYNSIKFDDEVTRFMFWRNLMDPYAREYKSGCGRWDLINLVRAAYALRPEGINWPKTDEGRPSFRLEELTKANNLVHDAAHDALSDVYATIAIARLIKDKNPRLFDHFFSLCRKDKAAEHMDLMNKTPFIHITSTASDTGCVSLMMPIALHPTNKNEVIAWDLTKDPEQLRDIDAATMRARLFTRRDEQPEGFERMPIRTIATNKSPAVVKNLGVLSDDRAAELGIDKAAALSNVARMMDVLAHRKDINALFKEVYNRALEPGDIDEALYSGFIDNNDRKILDQVTQMGAGDLIRYNPRFQDQKLNDLYVRYKGRNRTLGLTILESDEFADHLKERLINGANGHRTFEALQKQIDELRPTVDERKNKVLDALEEYSIKVKSDMEFFLEHKVFPESAQVKNTSVLINEFGRKVYEGLVEHLDNNQVFVFGSNPVGINGNPAKGTGGAALNALKNGWVSQGERMDNCLSECGKAWGITTVAYPGQKNSKTPAEIARGIHSLYDFAEFRSEKEFLVAYSAGGKNLNGYTAEQMAEMFASAPIPSNVVFEKNFANLIFNKNQAELDVDSPSAPRRKSFVR
jgi:exodeoxyribonuclease-1